MDHSSNKTFFGIKSSDGCALAMTGKKKKKTKERITKQSQQMDFSSYFFISPLKQYPYLNVTKYI